MMAPKELDGNNLFSHQSYMNRMPATFDARAERNGGTEDTETDTFQSDECDEKRSYTPQPRQITMLGGVKSQAAMFQRGGGGGGGVA